MLSSQPTDKFKCSGKPNEDPKLDTKPSDEGEEEEEERTRGGLSAFDWICVFLAAL